MKVLVITQYFWPENFRINDLCEELVKRGHELTVLTGKPNYPSGQIFAEYQASPNQFNAYKGCRVVRVPIIPRGTGKISLLMNYFSYSLMASTWGLRKLKNEHFDVVFICQLSPIFLALPGVLLGKRRRIPVVMWILDLWPESLASVGATNSAFVLGLVGKFVSFVYQRCTLLLGQSKAFYQGISEYNDDSSKVRYFPSWAESVFSCTDLSLTRLTGDRFKILFAGNIGEAQDFVSILECAQILKDRTVPVCFYILGDGRLYRDVCQSIKDKDLADYIVMLGRYPLEEMPAFYASADALLVTLRESPVFALTVPGKIQSYMAASKPILTMLTGEGSRVVDEAKCGYTANSGDYQKLANNAERMAAMSVEELSKLGQNAGSYSKKEFDREFLISELECWFDEVVSQAKL